MSGKKGPPRAQRGRKSRREQVVLNSELEDWLTENHLLSLRNFFRGLDLEKLSKMSEKELQKQVLDKIEGRDRMKEKVAQCVAELREKMAKERPLKDPVLRKLDEELELAWWEVKVLMNKNETYRTVLEQNHEKLLARKAQAFADMEASIAKMERRMPKKAKRVIRLAAKELNEMGEEAKVLTEQIDARGAAIAKVLVNDTRTPRNKEEKIEDLTREARELHTKFCLKYRDFRVMALFNPTKLQRNLRKRMGEILHIPLEWPVVVVHHCTDKFFAVLVGHDTADPNEIVRIEARIVPGIRIVDEMEAREKEKEKEKKVKEEVEEKKVKEKKKDVMPTSLETASRPQSDTKSSSADASAAANSPGSTEAQKPEERGRGKEDPSAEEKEADKKTWFFAEGQTEDVDGKGPWSLEFNGLQRATWYSIRVVAFNKYGPSPPVYLQVLTKEAPDFRFSRRYKSRGIKLFSVGDLLRRAHLDFVRRRQKRERAKIRRVQRSFPLEKSRKKRKSRRDLEREKEMAEELVIERELKFKLRVINDFECRTRWQEPLTPRVAMKIEGRWCSICVDHVFETGMGGSGQSVAAAESQTSSRDNEEKEQKEQKEQKEENVENEGVARWQFTMHSELQGETVIGLIRAKKNKPMFAGWNDSISSPKSRNPGVGFEIAFPDFVRAVSTIDGTEVIQTRNGKLDLPMTEMWRPDDNLELRLLKNEGILQLFRNGRQLGVGVTGLGGAWMPFVSTNNAFETTVELLQWD